jgi:predicted nucleic acid-binding Zn ribbon protein
MVTVPMPQHKHCTNCGKAIPPKEEMCSDKCKAEWDRTVKRKRYTMYAYIGFTGVIVLLLILGRGSS